MKYMGSKNRIAKEILPIILANRKETQWYVEPFCGGCNTIDKVMGNRLANDINPYLIAMFQGLQQELDKPMEIPKDLYDKARNQFNGILSGEPFSNFLIGWIGWMGSANGRFFDGGYAGKSNTKIGSVRDYNAESIKNILQQLPRLQDIVFTCKDYTALTIPNNSIIYCDIPYKDTKQYSYSKSFDYPQFYAWCRIMVAKGHTLFVSEYSMPEDFKCVWSKTVKSSLSANAVCGGNKDSVEKLFTL